ncbi:MAG: DNA recombination protein RmuC [Clostridia bacterium]|nr:DNA recombination protein RmuC [Clostridia bacterium]
MEIVIIVLCVFLLIVCAVSLFLTLSLISRIKKIEDNREDDKNEKKLDELKESIYNEFSRNRTEQNNSAQVQREEVSRKIGEVSKNLQTLTETNQEQLMRIYREMSAGLNATREKNAEMSEKQNQKIEAALEKIQQSNEKKLEEMRATVDEKLTNTLTQRLDSSFKTVSDQLENLYKALGEMKEMSGGITEHVTSLNRVLTNVKARGTWAEVQLKNILDQTIPGMYIENYSPSKNSQERVEFAIKIPSGDNYSEITYLPLDSKFPMEDYVRLCEAADRADKEATLAAKKALEDAVIREARSIKKYISVPKTTPFAIMYLASEGLYAEIAQSANAIPEKLQTEFNVMVAGPSTITALLNSLSLGFKIAAINEKANEVRKILSAVKSQYDTFSTVLAKAKKKIDEAGKSLDDAQHRNDIIQKKLKSIEEISVDESEEILGIDQSTYYLPDVDET